MKKKRVQNLFNICDEKIVGGSLYQARLILRSINTKKLNQEQRIEFAKLCRRSQLYRRGLRALSPLVKQLDKRELEISSDSDAEVWRPKTRAEAQLLSEYSILLMRTGGTREAIERLRDPALNDAPDTYLGRAACQIMQWNREEASENLMRYLRFQLTPYERLIGEVNLINAFISGSKLDESVFVLIEQAMARARGQKYLRLLGNCYELRAQAHIKLGRWSLAEQDLAQAEEQLRREGSLGSLFVRKWKTILVARRDGNIEELLNFRREALALDHWESVRSCDFEILALAFDQRRFDYLYLGTPLPHYRKLLEETFPHAKIPSEYLYGNAAAKVFDLTAGAWLEKSRGKAKTKGSAKCETGLNPGKKPHQLLMVLLKDFYKAQNAVELFMELYPSEKFDIETSLGRVQRVIGLARDEFARLKLPLDIVEREGRYRLKLREAVAIRIELQRERLSSFEIQWRELLKHIRKDAPFKSNLIREALKLPLTSSKRFLQEALKEGRLRSEGSGRATVYWLV